jgi:hypothetical protein
MITLAQAKALRHGEMLHANNARNSDGSCSRWKVNGAVRVWKRDPGRVRVPLKRGLWEYYHLTQDDLDFFHLEEDCPLRAAIRKVKKERRTAGI